MSFSKRIRDIVHISRAINFTSPYLRLGTVLLVFSLIGSGCVLAQPVSIDNPIHPSLTSTITVSQPPTTLATDLSSVTLDEIPTTTTETSIPKSLNQPTPSLEFTLTAWPTKVFTPTKGPTPTRTPTATNTPTITNTPTPPPQFLRIMRPGPYSKVTSPIRVNAIISPGKDGYVYYDLIGEDSRIITHQEMDLRRSIGARFEINEKIPFSINGVAESGRLVTYIKDEFGRISFLSSCDIILLSMGEDDYQPASIYQEPYIIRAPEIGDSIQGGILHVNGLLRPVNNKPVIIEVVDESLNVLAKTEIQLPFPSGDLSHAPFDISIPYQVSQLTSVSLIFRQESQTRLPGTVALSSLRIVLEP